MRYVSKMRIMVLVIVSGAIAIVAGCTSGRQMLRTEASTSGISAAEEVGAANVPQASLHLQLAKEELELARRLSVKKEEEQAASMLLRAEADAELALALSRGNAEKLEAQAAVERVRQLRQDNL